MQLTVDERRAVEAGVPLRCVVPGTQLTCVVLRHDVFAKLQLPVEVTDSDLLDDLYLDLSANAPDDWKAPEEWAVGANPS
ncbi:MAG: hypothetical protein HZA46_23130 [Planctomycetales bacterium]|nr:hypothetical protein [Planctomycetales bacterium]